jgi:nucleotide-binding universal stress UspA family protein
MKNLLVPVDFSDASNALIEKAGELAQELTARIVLLHVDEPKATQIGPDAFVAAWPLETPKRISRLEARLASLADVLEGLGIEVKYVALVGLVVDDILEQAEKYHADYIILGSHRHLAARHLFNGNVFAGVLRRSPCPTIVVPCEA